MVVVLSVERGLPATRHALDSQRGIASGSHDGAQIAADRTEEGVCWMRGDYSLL